MNVTLWIFASLLAAMFLMAGAQKLLLLKEKIVEKMGGWAQAFPPAALRGIGLVEVLGAIGLIVPAAVDVAPVVVPVAACGVALLMVGAVVTHGRRGEWRNAAVNVVLLALAAVTAWGRFGPWSF